MIGNGNIPVGLRAVRGVAGNRSFERFVCKIHIYASPELRTPPKIVLLLLLLSGARVRCNPESKLATALTQHISGTHHIALSHLSKCTKRSRIFIKWTPM